MNRHRDGRRDRGARGPARGRKTPAAEATQRHHAGFTLLEVVVGGFVLTLSIRGLAAAMSQGSRLSEAFPEKVVARDAMRTVLAQIANTPFRSVAGEFHLAGFAVPGLRAPPGDADGLPGPIVFEDGPADILRNYRLRIRVGWRGQAGIRSIEAVHLVTNVRGDLGVAPLVSSLATQGSKTVDAVLDTTTQSTGGLLETTTEIAGGLAAAAK